MIPYRRILLATAMVLSGNAVFGQPAWTGLTTAGAPVPGRETPSAVYDPSTNRLIMFGGLSLEVASDSYNEVWVLTNANGLGGTPSWTQLTTSCSFGLSARPQQS